MTHARAAATVAAIWRALGYAGTAVYAAAALLASALIIAITAVEPFEPQSLPVLAVLGGSLASSARFSQPVLRLATGVMFLGYEVSFIADTGLGPYVSGLSRPVSAKSEAARCVLFCVAQIASMLLTAGARAATYLVARRRAGNAA